MKLEFQEHSSIEYGNYLFPYCIYATKEPSDYYSEIYEKGFLPYTNNINLAEEVFYLARSLRVDLTMELWNYKQKNILNKLGKVYDNTLLEFKLQPKESILQNTTFENWCLTNAKNSFLTPERLKYILSRPYLERLLTISYNKKILAQIFIISEEKEFLHLWYSFYDLTITANDFGKWILLKTMEWAKEQSFHYFYIGTCYSKNAIYKLSLSKHMTYYNGNAWVNNISELKKQLLNGAL